MFNFSKIYNYLYIGKKGFYNLVFDLFSFFYIKAYFALLLFLNALIWGAAFYIDSQIDSAQAALHYNVDFGIDYYGNKNKIYIIPLLGLFVVMINFMLLANFSRSKDRRFISHILLISAFLANATLLVSVILVYLVNFW